MQGGFFIKDILGLKQKKSREEEGRGGTPLTFRPTASINFRYLTMFFQNEQTLSLFQTFIE